MMFNKPPPEQANAPPDPQSSGQKDGVHRQPQNSSSWNSTPLLLQKKAEVFLTSEIYPCLQKYPKSERFALCQDIKQTMSRVIMNSIRSNVKSRTDARLAVYEEVDADLKYMLVLISISRSQKYVTEGKAMQWQEKVAELGRILGGLIKAAKNAGNSNSPRQASLFEPGN
jgi:hypothetical protein